eukprot:COSAG05_NODE_13615_length_423_cov_1.114198_2_plen_91_part_01
MNQIFEIGGNLVKSDAAFNLMRLIAEGQGEDDDEDAELRAYAVNCYIDMLAKSQQSELSDILVQVCSPPLYLSWMPHAYLRGIHVTHLRR